MSLWEHSPDSLFTLNTGEIKGTVTSTAAQYLGFVEKQNQIFTFSGMAWGRGGRCYQYPLAPLRPDPGLSLFLLRFSPKLFCLRTAYTH